MRLQILGERPRHHQPLGMTIDEVVARRRQVGRAGHEIDVDPGVHLQAGFVGALDGDCERIEVGLRSERRRSRLDAALEVGVAAAADLNDAAC